VFYHISERSFSSIARFFVAVTIVIGCRGVLLAAPPFQAPTPAFPAPELPTAATADAATLEQVMARLQALEAEIRVLRQQTGAADALNTSAKNEAANEAAEAADKKPDDKGCGDKKAEKPKGPPTLVPFSSKCGDITFKPGVRIQGRYSYDDGTDDNDFFIRRLRLKGSGRAFDIADYGTEVKIDNTGKFTSDPHAVVENAWLDFSIRDELMYLRAGLYDLPFSRNLLTSDSKLLLMDRTQIVSALTDVGMCDNTIGLMLHGRPLGGHLEYAVGIFDNLAFGTTATRHSDELMPAGRVVVNLLQPVNPQGGVTVPSNGWADYKESYLGEGMRLALAVNAAQLNEVFDGANQYDLSAWGTDIFFNWGPFVFQAEYDEFTKDRLVGNPSSTGDGWYVQAGYILCCPIPGCRVLELAARYQEVDPNNNVVGDRLEWTSIGANFYIADHNLKIQTDYTFKREPDREFDNDMFQVQLQLDY
jgi:phosphate-selective porin